MPTIEEEYRAKYASQGEKDQEQSDLNEYYSSPEGAQEVVRRRIEDMTRGYMDPGQRPRLEMVSGRPVIFVGGERQFPTAKQREEHIARQQDELKRRAEENPPVEASTRIVLGLKRGQSGKANHLIKRFGADRVFQTNDGRLGYIDDKGEPRLVDKPGLEAADVLDLGSEMVQIAPGLVGTFLSRKLGPGKQLLTQGAADAAGAIAAQAMSAAIPGDEDYSPQGRLADVALNVGAGAAPGLAIQGAKAAYRAVGPAPRYGRQVAETLTGGGRVAAAASEGMRLEQAVGGPPLSASELANTSTAHGLYNTLRRDPKAAQYIQELDTAKGEALEAFAQKNIRAVTGGVSTSGAARNAGEAWNNHVKNLVMQRSKLAEKAFAEVERAAGGRPVFSLENTMRVQNEIERKFGTSFSTASGEAVVRGVKNRFAELNRMAQEAPGGVPMLRVRDFQNALSQWRQAAAGKEMAIENLDSRAVQRKVAGMVERALRADLDQAASLPVNRGGGVARGLLDTRRLYAQMSNAIESQDSRILRDAFKMEERSVGSSEKLARMIARGSYQQGEIRVAMGILGQASPDTAMALRAAVLEELLIKASRSGQFTPEALVRVLSDTRKQGTIKALMEGSPDAPEFFRRLVDSYRYAERISRRGTTAGGSPTAPFLFMSQVLKGVPLAGGVMDKIRELSVPLMNPRAMARAMNSAEGRKALLDLADPKASGSAENVLRSLTQLGIVLGAESILYDEPAGEAPLPRKE